MKSSILLKLRTPEFTLLKKARDLYFKKLEKRSTELLKQKPSHEQNQIVYSHTNEKKKQKEYSTKHPRMTQKTEKVGEHWRRFGSICYLDVNTLAISILFFF